jgi:hypothetical protein
VHPKIAEPAVNVSPLVVGVILIRENVVPTVTYEWTVKLGVQAVGATIIAEEFTEVFEAELVTEWYMEEVEAECDDTL